MTYLQNDVMLSTDSHPAAGLTYHIADVFVVELKEVCRGGTPSADVLQALLEPFCQVLAKSNRAAFLPRLRYADVTFRPLPRSVVTLCGRLWSVKHLQFKL